MQRIVSGVPQTKLRPCEEPTRHFGYNLLDGTAGEAFAYGDSIEGHLLREGVPARQSWSVSAARPTGVTPATLDRTSGRSIYRVLSA